MGVPGFFKFLIKKYPDIVCKCREEKSLAGNKKNLSTNSRPIPRKEDFDVLYVDMNCIIHQSMRSYPHSESEIIKSVFRDLDRIVSIVRPRKMVYIAIDGVAPKAKMNQQRSRRFKRSKEPAERTTSNKEDQIDVNCITPGTEFMCKLSSCIHYYVHTRLEYDSWKNLSVIFSDANVPGEGEQKIADFIRRQRVQPSYDSNTKHVLCGPDADLIILGLATHEKNVTVIRKQSDQQYVFVRLWILRRYLEIELKMPNLQFQFDLERAIDDWVFLCTLIGNDFLPGLPFLKDEKDAVDTLVMIYKDCLPKSKEWATQNGKINFDVFQLIISQIGQADITHIQKQLMYKKPKINRSLRLPVSSSVEPQASSSRSGSVEEPKPHFLKDGSSSTKKQKFQGDSSDNLTPACKRAKGNGGVNPLSSTLPSIESRGISSPTESVVTDPTNDSSSPTIMQKYHGSLVDDKQIAFKMVEARVEEDEETTPLPSTSASVEPRVISSAVRPSTLKVQKELEAKLNNYKEWYYSNKFVNFKQNDEFRHQIAMEYIRGLCWVTKSYYQFVPSWTWFYPYEDAPFSSDMTDVSSSDPDFTEETRPLRPLEQLMAVLPASSWSLVPLLWGKLITDPKSPVIDFYEIKSNSRDPLMPFVDEDRLIAALSKVFHELNEAEIKRNIVGEIQLYVGKHHKGYEYLRSVVWEFPSKLEPSYIGGISGAVFLSEKCVQASETLASPLQGMKALNDRHVVCVNYNNPVVESGYHEPSRNLSGEAHSMEAHEVVPDVIDVGPPATMMIKYNNELSASTVLGGNELIPSLVRNPPSCVEWPVEEGALYTLCMIDPDVPSRTTPKLREWHHWLVVNIPGNDVQKGEVLSEYIGSGPLEGTGLHR